MGERGRGKVEGGGLCPKLHLHRQVECFSIIMGKGVGQLFLFLSSLSVSLFFVGGKDMKYLKRKVCRSSDFPTLSE